MLYHYKYHSGGETAEKANSVASECLKELVLIYCCGGREVYQGHCRPARLRIGHGGADCRE